MFSTRTNAVKSPSTPAVPHWRGESFFELTKTVIFWRDCLRQGVVEAHAPPERAFTPQPAAFRTPRGLLLAAPALAPALALFGAVRCACNAVRCVAGAAVVVPT